MMPVIDSNLSAADDPTLVDDTIPVMHPKLPTADRLLPYLRRIDNVRIYSNFGPLAMEFQSRLSDHFGLSSKCVVVASCGTAALMAAIFSAAGPATKDRPYALIPGFTFAATAVAAERCGYRAYFADIDADSWRLDPERLFDHHLLDRIGVVIPVAPFGRPVPQSPWHDFREHTRIPVVIDAAASFDCVCDSPAEFFHEIPVVLSFHATKSLSTGEGGCVVSSDVALVDRVAQALNFGINMTRDSAMPSLNGKLSEYHAAVGLAELDNWMGKRTSLREVIQIYRREMVGKFFLPRLVVWPEISGCYAQLFCRSAAEADRIQNELHWAKIDFRFWYRTGVHCQTQFLDNPRDALEVTENIARRLIGLPMAPDLPREAIKRVVAAVCAAVEDW
jgi:dTDP-4-amino-4,6-dideoxygalactose transaminase